MAAAKNAKPQNDTKPEGDATQQQNQDKPEGGATQQNNKQTTMPGVDVPNQHPTMPGVEVPNKQPSMPGVESANSYRNYRNYFNEDGIKFTNSSSSNPNKGQTLTGAGNDQVKNAGETNTNLGKATVNKMDAKDINVANGVDAQVKELLDIDIRNREASINGYVMISTAIATEAFNAFKLTNKDFFDILKAHVQWYLANPGAEKDSANTTTRVRNLNMNATTAPVNNNQGEDKPATAGGQPATASGEGTG
jgi:hypothetical protein